MISLHHSKKLVLISFSFKTIYLLVVRKIPHTLVGRYKTETSAVKANWSVLVGFREIRQSGSLLHKEAVNSYFKLISKLEVAEISIFKYK